MTSTVGNITELPPGSRKLVQAGGKLICLVNLGGSVYAIDELCPHRAGPLSEGKLEGSTITCPWHGATFEVRTGEKLSGPAPRGLKSYPVRIQGDEILVET